VDREDQGASGRDPDDDWAADADGDGLRGWISPDDRLWRHPSEAGASESAASPTWPGPPTGPRGRTGFWIIGGATACFVLALVAASLIVTTTGGNDDTGVATAQNPVASAPTTEAGPGQADPRVVGRSTVEALVDSMAPSTVALRVVGSAGTTVVAGVVAEAQGIIVTAARALAGARSVTVIQDDGTRLPATVVASDPGSGLAVVSVADDLPAPDFEDGDQSSGTTAMAMSLEPARHTGKASRAEVYAGTVTSTGASGADGLAAITVAAPLGSDDLGCPLIGGKGVVSGLLESVLRSGHSVRSVFLPGKLVQDVALQLVEYGTVDHGWLGVGWDDAATATVTSTTTGGAAFSQPQAGGVRLEAVTPGSPAADSGMAVGDVIVAIDGERVDSGADLTTSLYADGPGTVVDITYDHDGSGPFTAPVVLATSRGDAPVLSSSS
jgi:putative serine protease PepD